MQIVQTTSNNKNRRVNRLNTIKSFLSNIYRNETKSLKWKKTVSLKDKIKRDEQKKRQRERVKSVKRMLRIDEKGLKNREIKSQKDTHSKEKETSK